MGRVTRMEYPHGWVEEYEYDAVGRLLRVTDTDPSGKDMKQQKHVYEYDACGNLTYEYMRGNGTGEATVENSYTYDELHRIVSAHENYGSQSRYYTYDSLGSLTYEEDSRNNQVDYILNNLNQVVESSGDGWKTSTAYTYDGRGNLVKEVYGKNKKVTTVGEYTYDETNKLVVGCNALGESSEYLYNGLGALVQNTWVIAKNGYGYHDVDAMIEGEDIIDPDDLLIGPDAPVDGEDPITEPETPEVDQEPAAEPETPVVDQEPAAEPEIPAVDEEPAAEPEIPVVDEEPAAEPETPAVDEEPAAEPETPDPGINNEGNGNSNGNNGNGHTNGNNGKGNGNNGKGNGNNGNSSTTEPDVTEPDVTEPDVTEPDVTEPDVTEPEADDSGNGNSAGNNGQGNGNSAANGDGNGSINKTSTVVKQFVVDYNTETFEPLMEHEVNGLDYKYVYGNDRLSVDISPINNSMSIVENGDHIRLYYHMDYLGTADYLTSPVSLKVEAWTHYNEWGEIVHNAVLNCGQRELDLVKRYATHDYDSVLELYYAKARFYDADNHRFTAMDPILDPSQYDIREYMDDPMQLVQYLYVVNNPIVFIDPLGLIPEMVTKLDNLDWDSLDSYTYNTVTYYSIADIFTALSDGDLGYAPYDKASNTSSFHYTYDQKTAYVYYDLADVPRATIFGFSMPWSQNNVLFKGIVGRGTQLEAEKMFFYHDQRVYTTKSLLRSYFMEVWCENEKNNTVQPILPVMPEPIPSQQQLVTKGQLVEFGWRSISDAEVNELNRVLEKYEINTALRISFFLGNVKKETWEFTRTLEKFNLDPGAGIDSAEDYFNSKYATANGNIPGTNDGELFRGSGLIQLTGRKSYQAFANFIGDQTIMEQGYRVVGGTYNRPVSEITKADDLSVIDLGKYAFESAGWFWTHSAQGKNLNLAADEKNWRDMHKGINPGAKESEFIDRNKFVNEFFKIYTGQELNLPTAI